MRSNIQGQRKIEENESWTGAEMQIERVMKTENKIFGGKVMSNRQDRP